MITTSTRTMIMICSISCIQHIFRIFFLWHCYVSLYLFLFTKVGALCTYNILSWVNCDTFGQLFPRAPESKIPRFVRPDFFLPPDDAMTDRSCRNASWFCLTLSHLIDYVVRTVNCCIFWHVPICTHFDLVISDIFQVSTEQYWSSFRLRLHIISF